MHSKLEKVLHNVFRTFSDFGYCYPFWRYSRSKWEGVRNWAKLSMLFAPNFFWEWTSKFLDQHL